jgi:ribosomal protein L7/L12
MGFKAFLGNYDIPELPQRMEEYYNNTPDEKIDIFITFSDLIVYPKKDINSCMEGYRFVNDKGIWNDLALENKWNKNWIIIATHDGNPIIADLDFDNIPVKFAYHGAGKWDFNYFFNKIDDFLKFIRIMIEVTEQNEYFQEYINKEYENFIGLLKKEFTEAEVNGILEFFCIERYEEKITNKKRVYIHTIYVEELGQNKTKVLIELKKYLGLKNIHEVKNLENNLPVKFTERGGHENSYRAKILEDLGAKVKIKKEEV